MRLEKATGKPCGASLAKVVLLVSCGGCLTQLAGCVAGLIPTVAGYGEMVLLRGLLGQFLAL